MGGENGHVSLNSDTKKLPDSDALAGDAVGFSTPGEPPLLKPHRACECPTRSLLGLLGGLLGNTPSRALLCPLPPPAPSLPSAPASFLMKGPPSPELLNQTPEESSLPLPATPSPVNHQALLVLPPKCQHLSALPAGLAYIHFSPRAILHPTRVTLKEMCVPSPGTCAENHSGASSASRVRESESLARMWGSVQACLSNFLLPVGETASPRWPS